MNLQPLGNPRHEAFAQAYARCREGKRAALEAGYFSATSENYPAEQGSKLLKRPDVRLRIAVLEQQVAKEMAKMSVATAVDRTWVLRMLAQNVERAFTEGDRGAVNRGLELLGREHGLFTEKKHIVTESLLDQLSAPALLALADLLKRAGADPAIRAELVRIVPQMGEQFQALSGVDQVTDLEFVPGAAPEAADAAGATAGEGPPPPDSTTGGVELGLPGHPSEDPPTPHPAEPATPAKIADPELEDLL